jgi:hypothetical protein
LIASLPFQQTISVLHLRQLSDPDVMPSSGVQIDTFAWTKIGVLV